MQRAPTLRMVRNLDAGLGIPTEILVKPYDLADSAVNDAIPGLVSGCTLAG